MWTWPTSRQCLYSLVSGTKPGSVVLKIYFLNRIQYHTTSSNAPHKCLSSGFCVTALLPCAGDAELGCCGGSLTIRHGGRSPDTCSFIVLSVSLHVHVLHTCRHMAEKSGVHHLSGYQLQTDGQFQRKCVSLLKKWEEWSVKDVQWTQLPRKCAGK